MKTKKGQLPPPPEKVVLRQVLDFLSLHKIPAWRSNSGGMHAEHKGKKRYVRFNGADGMADIIGVIPRMRAANGDLLAGIFLAVECKRPGKRATASQLGFLDAIIAAGGLAFVVSDVRDLERVLRAEGVIA